MGGSERLYHTPSLSCSKQSPRQTKQKLRFSRAIVSSRKIIKRPPPSFQPCQKEAGASTPHHQLMLFSAQSSQYLDANSQHRSLQYPGGTAAGRRLSGPSPPELHSLDLPVHHLPRGQVSTGLARQLGCVSADPRVGPLVTGYISQQPGARGRNQ